MFRLTFHILQALFSVLLSGFLRTGHVLLRDELFKKLVFLTILEFRKRNRRS
jgi:hypothetical protein